MSKKKVVYHNRVTMNNRLAVVVGIGEAWSTIVEGPKAIILATDSQIVEAVLTGDIHKAINLWNEVDAGTRRENYDPDTSDMALKVKWIKIGQLFRIVWNSAHDEEVIEDYNPSEWHRA